MKTKLIYTLMLAFLLSSCDKFLDIVPVGKLIPKTVEDYEQMFNDDYSLKLLNDPTFFGAPNFGMNDASFKSADYYDRACYIWSKQVFEENSISYTDWANIYSEIYIDNVILDQINEATGDETFRKQVIAEARTRRAFSYLLLVGIYAPQYDKATAETDLGVPLRLSADVSGNAPARSSVKAVYDFILTEIQESWGDLPDQARNKFRVSKATGNAILARTYLMMGEYDEAWTYADKALSGNNHLFNYNGVQVDEDGDAPRVSAPKNDEYYLIRYYQYVNTGLGTGISKELYDLFPHDGTDLREEFEVQVDDQDFTLDSIYFNKMMVMTVAPTVPEMYLIRAEGYARKGDAASLQKAMEDINHLRSSRMVTGTPDLQATTQDAVMDIVLAERRRELNIQAGLNWLDMKRLNKEPKYARTLTRTMDGKTYTLAPNSRNYVMPIPYDVLGYNSAIIDNPRD